MLITFKSVIKDDKKVVNKIEFNSPVEVSEEYGFAIYQFEEPSQKIMNRIEVSSGAINIFTGPATLNLALNKDLDIEYSTEHGSIYITSHLQKVIIKKDHVSFEYTLKQKNVLIGNYHITLEVHK